MGIMLGTAILSIFPNPKLNSATLLYKNIPSHNVSYAIVTSPNVIVNSVKMENVPKPTSTPIPTQSSSKTDQKNIISSIAKSITPTIISEADIRAYITTKFGVYASVATCIAQHESGFNPNAIHYNSNGTIDRGVFQINSIHGYDPSTLFNWKDNIDIAYTMSGAGTIWDAWATKPYCT